MATSADLKFTLRALRHAPWYAVTIIGVTAVTLALATTVFAVVDGVLFRPLSYPDADRLVTIEPNFQGMTRPELGAGLTLAYSVSEVDLANWQAAAPDVKLTAFNPSRWAELGPGVNADTAGMAQVQSNFFDVVGVQPLHGGFSDDDFLQTATQRPVILSHDTWQSRFGGASDVVGRTVVIDPTSGFGLRVVGVMPRGFVFPSTRADIDFLTPLVSRPEARTNPTSRSLSSVIARLPDWLSPEVFEERLRPALAATAAQFPPRGPRPEGWSEAYWRTQGPYDIADVVPLEAALVRQSGRMFLGVFVAVAVLILIAGANVSSLMTSRASERRRELEVRRALGASPGGIARLWILEVATLLAAGAVLGVLAAVPLLALIVSLLPEQVVLLKPARLDWRAAGFVAMTAVGLCVLVTIAPVRRSLQAPAGLAKGGASERVRTPGRFLVVGGQVAAVFVLTVLGACLVGSLLAVYGNELPVKTRDVQVVEVRVQGPGRGNRPSDERTQRGERILERLGQLPGVSGAALVAAQLLRGGGWSSSFAPPPGRRRLETVDTWAVTGDFYRVLDLKPIEGRLPTDAERFSSAPLIVVSERVARAYWPNGPAVGHTLIEGFEKAPYTVIGVVHDVRWFAWDMESPMIYGPYGRLSRSSLLTFFVRREGRIGPTIDETLRAVTDADPMVRPFRAAALEDLFRESIRLRRFQSWLFGGFAAAALAVMGVGILGLLAMSTARRTKEIGIRCALGATPRAVTRLLVREQLVAVLAGLAVGGIVAAWAVRLVQGYVYQLSVTDPRIWGAAVLLILLTSLGGAFLPAVRASRADPLTALRTE
ncbi:MAG: FtsX-like permease family protein [Vicinamibacterales bacterium]